MYYPRLVDGADGPRVAEGLLRLRAGLSVTVPKKTLGDSLLLATWNIREFGRQRLGPRSAEALGYIAEVVSHFDLIAIQEVNDNLDELEAVRRLLGRWWEVIYTDVTAGTRGNQERLAFLYDSRTVRFNGLAGEIVLPAQKGAETVQFARTPFTCGFTAGWKKIELCTVHIIWGESVAVTDERVAEIGNIAKALAKRAKKNQAPNSPHTVLLGDFNIFNREDATYQALTSAGFDVPEALQTIPGSNVAKTKRHYDQIAFLKRVGTLEASAAGVFDFYEHVFRDGEDDAHYDTGKKSFREWRTYQMSDHLPMWVQLRVDGTDDYLAKAAAK